MGLAGFHRADYFYEHADEDFEAFGANNVNVAMILFKILHELKEINRKLED